MPKPKVAVLGAGFFARFHYDAWARLPEVELAAACDLRLEAAQAMANAHGIARVFDSLDAMLDAVKPDILDIAAPPQAHLPAIRSAAARGIFTICQKPFGGTLAGAAQAVDIARKAGIGLAVHENFRFQPWYGEIKRRLDGGELGRVYQATFRLRPGDGRGPSAYLDRQPYFQTMKRFLIHETAIHLIDVFRYLLGEPAGVYAHLARLNPAIAGEDSGLVLLDYANGARALFDGNRLADHPARNRRLTMGEMTIEGEGGTIRLDGDGNIHARDFGANDERKIDYAWRDSSPGGDSVYRLQAHIVRHLLSGEKLQNSGEAYLANLRIEEAVYAANDQGSRVAL
jgi:D-apiose dehydrogenase